MRAGRPRFQLVLHGLDRGDTIGEFGFFSDAEDDVGNRQAVQIRRETGWQALGVTVEYNLTR